MIINSTWWARGLSDIGAINLFSYCKSPDWRAAMRRAKRLSKQRHVDMDDLSFCMQVLSCITALAFNQFALATGVSIEYAIVIKEQYRKMVPQKTLYFHHNPLAFSSPRDFWGFFSLNPDPSVLDTRFENLGWNCSYEV